jgi:hypothetical protein
MGLFGQASNAASLVVTSLLLFVPGLGAALAVHGPGEVGVATRLALVAGLGTAVGGAVSFVLSVIGILEPLTFFLVLGAVSTALWIVAARRHGLGAHGRAILQEIRQDPWSIGIGLAVIVGLAIFRLTFSPLRHFGNSTAWRYWADGLEVADAGSIPSTSLQYGRLLPPTTSKVMLSTLEAGISFAIGREPLPALGALLWLGSVGLAVSLWSLGRELGLRVLAPLVPVLTLANDVFLNKELTADLVAFKAEIFGRMVAFAALALAVRAIREREGLKDALVSGALFGVAAGIHLVPVVIAAIMLGTYLVAHLIVERDLKGTALRAAVIAGTTAMVAILALLLPPGDIGLQGAVGDEAYSAFAPGFDPTRYLNSGVLPGRRVVTSETWDISPGRALATYVSSATGVRGRTAPGWATTGLRYVLPIGGLVAAVAMLLWFPRRLKAIGLVAWGLGTALVLLTTLFTIRYDFYIQAWFGVRRLFDYSSIPVVLIMLALLEGVFLFLSKGPPWLPSVAGTLTVATVAALLILHALPAPEKGPEDRGLIAPFDWIRANVPCDARMLPNAHTEGVFEALTGRVALLEGMTPYLRPAVLSPIIELLLEARAFFHDPAAHAELLSREGVDYVVLLRAGAVGYREPIGRANTAELDGVPFLRARHRSGAMVVYEVLGLEGEGTFPLPAAVPGYRCARDPIRR